MRSALSTAWAAIGFGADTKSAPRQTSGGSAVGLSGGAVIAPGFKLIAFPSNVSDPDSLFSAIAIGLNRTEAVKSGGGRRTVTANRIRELLSANAGGVSGDLKQISDAGGGATDSKFFSASGSGGGDTQSGVHRTIECVVRKYEVSVLVYWKSKAVTDWQSLFKCEGESGGEGDSKSVRVYNRSDTEREFILACGQFQSQTIRIAVELGTGDSVRAFGVVPTGRKCQRLWPFCRLLSTDVCIMVCTNRNGCTDCTTDCDRRK